MDVAAYNGYSDRRCARDAIGWDGRCSQHGISTPIEAIAAAAARGEATPYASMEERIYGEAVRRGLQDAWLLARDIEREFLSPEAVRSARERARRVARTTTDAAPGEVVYFCRRESLIKIGVSKNVARRMVAISKGGQMPPGMTVGPVKLLATTPGSYRLEAELHNRFAHLRVDRTEWFRVAPELLRLIDRFRRRVAALEPVDSRRGGDRPA